MRQQTQKTNAKKRKPNRKSHLLRFQTGRKQLSYKRRIKVAVSIESRETRAVKKGSIKKVTPYRKKEKNRIFKTGSIESRGGRGGNRER